MSERDPILPQNGSRRSRTSFLSNLSSRRSSKNLTVEEVHPNGDDSPAPLAPAAAVPASERTSLHDPRWAEENALGVKPNALARFRHTYREELAEFVGSSLIIFFGAGVQCSVYLHGGTGDYLSCRFAWAVGVAMGIFAAGGVSGAHLNPTVTIALSIFRGFPARKVLGYIVAQILGCAFAALVIYANYYYSIEIFEGGPSRTVTGPNATAGLFFTFPQPFLPASSAFLSEFLASALLILIVFSLSDKNNLPPPQGTMPFAMFLALLGIGASLGSNTGYAMNGARDSGPRIALWLVGYGNEVWSNGHLWFAWGPWIAAIAGGLFGGFAYDFMIYNGQDSPLNRPVARSPEESAIADEYHD